MRVRSVVTRSGPLCVCRNSKGLGVYARYGLMKGDVAEVAPYIIVGQSYDDAYENGHVDAITWAYNVNGKLAIALGYGSLYNHSYKANVDWKIRTRSKTILYTAYKDIDAGDELTINYLGSPRARGKLDFDVIE